MHSIVVKCNICGCARRLSLTVVVLRAVLSTCSGCQIGRRITKQLLACQARVVEGDEPEQRQPKLRSISGPGGGSTAFRRPPYPGAGSSSPEEPLPASTSTRAKSLGTDARFVFTPFLSGNASPQSLTEWPHQPDPQQTLQQQQQQQQEQQEREQQVTLRSERRRQPDSLLGGNASSSAPAQTGGRQKAQPEAAPAAAGQGGKPKRKYRSRLNIPQRPFLAAASAARMEAARMVQQAEESSDAAVQSAPSSVTTSPILGVATSPSLGVGGPTASSASFSLLSSPDLLSGGSPSALPSTPVTPASGGAAGEAGPQGAGWQFPATSLASPTLRDPPAGTPRLRQGPSP